MRIHVLTLKICNSINTYTHLWNYRVRFSVTWDEIQFSNWLTRLYMPYWSCKIGCVYVYTTPFHKLSHIMLSIILLNLCTFSVSNLRERCLLYLLDGLSQVSFKYPKWQAIIWDSLISSYVVSISYTMCKAQIKYLKLVSHLLEILEVVNG